MIKAKVNFEFHPPKFALQKDLLHIAERIFIPFMIDGIDKGIGVDGQKFPTLERSTAKAKGHSRPLINTRKLLRSFIFRKRGSNSVIITLKSTRKEIGKFLQIDGIRSVRGKKHFNFFGISSKMESAAMNFMRQRIERAIQNA